MAYSHIALYAVVVFGAAAVVFGCYALYKRIFRHVPGLAFVFHASQLDGVVNESRSTCLICLEDYAEGDELCELGCNHAFHKACFRKMVPEEAKKLELVVCPICRGKIHTSPIVQIG